MSKHAGRIAVLGFLIVLRSGLAGDFSDLPKNWARALDTDATIFGFGLHLGHNNRDMIRRELLDAHLLRLMAKFGGLSERDLATVQLLPAKTGDNVWLVQLGKFPKAFDILEKLVPAYIRARMEGHTSAFLMVALANRPEPSALSDADLRVLAAKKPMLPLLWLVKAKSGTTIQEAGQVVRRSVVKTYQNGKQQVIETTEIPKVDESCRWVLFIAEDGEIVWQYYMQYKADASLDYIREDKCDAKEYDDRYRAIIKDVEQEAESEMKKAGRNNQLGACHTFWQLKKEKLKAKGIEWRSPAELNPLVCYD